MFLFNRNALIIALIVLGSVFFVSSPAFASHFTVSVAPSLGQVDLGGSASFVVTATCQTSPCEEIGFNISGLPAGVSPTYSTGSCTPNCSAIITLSALSSASVGVNLPITVEGQGSSHNASAVYTLTIIDPNGGAPINKSWLQTTDSSTASDGFNLAGNSSAPPGSTAVSGSGNSASIA